MKNQLLLAIFCMGSLALRAQSSSVYHVESEYTPQNGYRYYFDKMDPQTGVSTRLTQLPIIGFFTGYSFFNCFGNYVFQGIDTTMPNGDYINKLYELDTLGNLVRTLPMDTATGTWYKMCLPSADSPYYYALRWSTTGGQWVLETINAVTGSRSVQTLTQLANYSFLNSDAAITRDDIIWMGMDCQMIGASVLLSVNPLNGNVGFEDTLQAGYYYDCLNYNCATDTMYGFIAHMDSVNGSELLKIHGTGSAVIHSGNTAIGSGTFSAGVHTRLPDGSFYVKTTGQTYLLPDFNVSVPTFTMPVVTSSSLPVFCFAAPRESCIYYVACNETASLNSTEATGHPELFPNPVTNGILHVKQQGDFAIELTDASGRSVYSAKGNSSLEIPVNAFAPGVYFIRLEQEENVVIRKVIISN